jgi:release factor glutamine methyltransferase
VNAGVRVVAGRGESLTATTVREALQAGERVLRRAGVESARLDAELLLGNALAAERKELYLRLDRPLDEDARRRFEDLLLRRGRREPLAYILGEKEFWSLDFVVTPDVLVPRPETELLVETGLNILARRRAGARVLELGTGSGAVAVSLAKERSDLAIHATDLSPAALKIARLNAKRHGVAPRIEFLAGDLFEPVGGAKAGFELVVFNPPYIAAREMDHLPPEVREWEPKLALFGGVDGLDFYRRIVREAPLHLAEDGVVALEIGAGMAQAVAAVFADAGRYKTLAVHRDLAGRDRVVTAQLRSRSRAS